MGTTGTTLSSNWRQLQKTLEKVPSTISTDSLKRKSPSVGSSIIASSSTITSAKRTKRARGTPHNTTATKITNPANPPSIPQAFRPVPTSKAPKMSVAAAEPSATLALWAEDNDISPADLRKAYNLPLTSTTLPPLAGSAIEPGASGASSATETGKYISLDCEMVGVGGPTKERSALARVSIVNYHGHVILDTFVRPKERVTDWRSWVSGVTPAHMVHAREFEDVQKEVSSILTDRVLVGHAVQNDLEVLLLSHPRRDIRDTSQHPGFRKLNAGRPPGLKKLAHKVLGIEIQGGEHSSVEDARACMLLYRKFRDEIEKLHKPKVHKPKGASSKSDKKKKEKKKEKKKKA